MRRQWLRRGSAEGQEGLQDLCVKPLLTSRMTNDTYVRFQCQTRQPCLAGPPRFISVRGAVPLAWRGWFSPPFHTLSVQDLDQMLRGTAEASLHPKTDKRSRREQLDDNLLLIPPSLVAPSTFYHRTFNAMFSLAGKTSQALVAMVSILFASQAVLVSSQSCGTPLGPKQGKMKDWYQYENKQPASKCPISPYSTEAVLIRHSLSNYRVPGYGSGFLWI